MDRLLDNAPCGYVIFTDEGIIQWMNGTLLGWLGLRSEDVFNKHVEVILTLPSRIFYNTHFFPLLKLQGKAEEIFLQLKTTSNETVPVLVNAERRQESEAWLHHCVILPVHQRQKYEEEILNAKRLAEKAMQENLHLQELKSTLETKSLELERHYRKQFSQNQSLLQFSKIISHDLQEPIHKIQLFADRILTKETVSARTRNDLLKVDRSAERLRQLTRALQQYISIDAETGMTDVNIRDIILEAARQVNEVRKVSGSEYNIVIEDIPVMTGNMTQLTLLFYHLLDNAIQFRDPSRKLVVNVKAVTLDENIYHHSPERYKFTEHARIFFSDNGIGFDMQYRDYIFKILKKISASDPGLGVGLGLIKKIVDNHSGVITVDSVVGQGTTFIITLPKHHTQNSLV